MAEKFDSNNEKSRRIAAISAITNSLDMQYFFEQMLQDRYGVSTLLDLTDEQLDKVEKITQSWQNLAAASIALSQSDTVAGKNKTKK